MASIWSSPLGRGPRRPSTWVSLLLLLLVSLSASALARPPTVGVGVDAPVRTTLASPGTVEYQCNARQVGFRLPAPAETVVTFHPSTQVAAALASNSIHRALGKGCRLLAEDKQPIDTDLPLAAVFLGDAPDDAHCLSPAALAAAPHSPIAAFLVCGAEGADVYSVARAQSLREAMTPADRANLERVGALAAASNEEREFPHTLGDLMHNTLAAAFAWVRTFIEEHWGPLHPFMDYNVAAGETGIYDMQSAAMLSFADARTLAAGKSLHKGAGATAAADEEDEIRITLSADWGSGTREAFLVSELMIVEKKPHYTIHIGDVYYTGSVEETRTQALGETPAGVKRGVKWNPGSLGSFAFQGNHEMYSRGFGYFDHWLPAAGPLDKTTGKPLGQKASYASLENEHWRVIGLDTGYNTYSMLLHSDDNRQPASVIDWLKNVVKINDPADKRGIILLTHHQYFSAFERGYYATPTQIAELVGDRTLIWLWGHEHKYSWYQKGSGGGLPLSVYGRCIGVGGFPIDHVPIPVDARAHGLVAYDNRLYDINVGELYSLPIGFNGYTALTLRGNNATIEYRTLVNTRVGGAPRTNETSAIVRETFTVDETGSARLASFKILDSRITKLQHELSLGGDVGNGRGIEHTRPTNGKPTIEESMIAEELRRRVAANPALATVPVRP